MPLLTAQELSTASACIDSCTSNGQKLSIIIYLLATSAGVPTDAQTLVTNAACLDSCVPPGMAPAIIISLLDSINATTAAAGYVTCGVGAPVAAPASGACGWYVDTNNSATYFWNGSAWILKS